MKRIITLLLALALCLGTAAMAEEAGLLGTPFPDFTATDSEGNVFTLSEALKDHEAALVNIWATWCGPCEFEVPFLQEAYEAYGDRVAFICLSREEEDTAEVIEAYRRDHGLTLPMGRDEGLALYEYIAAHGEGSIPATVIVDRFGNVGFIQEYSFQSSRALRAVIERFLGDDYTETAVLDGVPLPDATAAFPVAAARDVIVENEGARELHFTNDAPSTRLKAWVVNDDTAHLRLELTASDSPYDMICYNWDNADLSELSTLLDAERNGYYYDVPMPDAEAELPIASACLMEFAAEDISDAIDCYFIRSEDQLALLQEYLGEEGWTLSDDGEAPAAQDAPQAAYVLHVVDQYGDPVPGMYVNFCTDTACVMTQSDASGTITFEGETDAYHVQLLKAPEGYSFDAGYEMYTPREYGEWRLSIRKD